MSDIRPDDQERDPGDVPDDDGEDTAEWPLPADDPAEEPTADTTGMGDPEEAESEGGEVA